MNDSATKVADRPALEIEIEIEITEEMIEIAEREFARFWRLGGPDEYDSTQFMIEAYRAMEMCRARSLQKRS